MSDKPDDLADSIRARVQSSLLDRLPPDVRAEGMRLIAEELEAERAAALPDPREATSWADIDPLRYRELTAHERADICSRLGNQRGPSIDLKAGVPRSVKPTPPAKVSLRLPTEIDPETWASLEPEQRRAILEAANPGLGNRNPLAPRRRR